MATVNLGRIKPVFRGAYNNSTAYVVDDIVTSSNETFIAIQAGSGNATSNASYWTKLAAKGADGSNGTDLTSTLTTQGDILYRDGSGLQRLAKGTAGTVLKINSGATAPEWGADEGGKIVNVFYQAYTAVLTQSTSSTGTFRDVPNLTQTITPASVDSKFLISFRLSMGTDGNHTYARINAGGNAVHIANASGSSLRTTSSVSAKTTWDMDELTGTFLWDANTASSTTIKIQYAVEGTGYINRGERDDGNWYDSRAVSEMTIFEINN